jgi:uncharacterized CHY-type Zn-finger protein
MIKKICSCDECGKEWEVGEFFNNRGLEEVSGKLICGECRKLKFEDKYRTTGGRDEK